MSCTCAYFTKKTFFLTISGQKCCEGREGSSSRGLFDFFYESRNDERAMLITEVFVLKLESWPLQFATQIICLSISQTIANTKSNGRVRYFICWRFMILQINVIFFNRQNTSQQKVRRQSGTEKHGSINEDLWIYFDPVYFAQTINYYWIQWVSLLITLVHYINNNSSLETFSPVRKLCTCIVLSWTEGNTAGAWTATLSNFILYRSGLDILII